MNYQTGKPLNYGLNSLIVYRPFAGSDRTVRVNCVERDIKDGRPGFTGIEVSTNEEVWGYDSQILLVVKE